MSAKDRVSDMKNRLEKVVDDYEWCIMQLDDVIEALVDIAQKTNSIPYAKIRAKNALKKFSQDYEKFYGVGGISGSSHGKEDD